MSGNGTPAVVGEPVKNYLADFFRYLGNIPKKKKQFFYVGCRTCAHGVPFTENDQRIASFSSKVHSVYFTSNSLLDMSTCLSIDYASL